MAKTILLTLTVCLVAPVAGATSQGVDHAVLRAQQQLAQQVLHRDVRQQNEALRRRLDLQGQRAHTVETRPATTETKPQRQP